MKIKDILVESDTPASTNKLDKGQVATLKGAVSMPDISNNKSNGSAYLQYRYGIALAGAHPNKDKSEHMDAVGAFSGDPLMMTYTDEEGDMMQNALDMVGGGRMLPLGSRKSIERDDTNKASPVRSRKSK